MTKIEALELELAARKMVEGTELGWVEVLRQKECHGYVCNNLMLYTDVELALGIIEGKPVWSGGIHYDARGEYHITGGTYTQAYLDTCSLNPPKPTTVMVELPIEIVTDILRSGDGIAINYTEIVAAFHKALEEVK